MPREKGYTSPFLSSGVHYNIITPPVVYSGQIFWITVIVATGLGGTKTDYSGTTTFTSTDSAALIENTSMDIYNYTWVPAIDGGIRMFFRVCFTKLGMQNIIAADIMDGSITGLAVVMVVGVDVKLFKEPRLMVAASGDTVQFRICWSNYSSGSALSFVITDAVPMGTTYVPQVASNHICGTTKPIVYDLAYATSQSSMPPGTGWVTTVGTPTANTFWIRWTIRSVDINTTGCVCFRVSVN